MRVWGALLFALGLMAQDTAPTGIVRGTFLESEESGRTGQFSLRTANNSVFRFLFDDKTYIERMRQRVAITGLSRGESVEVVSDQGGSMPRLRYARIVRVLADDPGAARPRSRLYGSYRPPTEEIVPRGALAFAGVVLRRDSGSVTLRMRSHEVRRILLRPDTRFLRDGLLADAAALTVNTRVFVRASETLDREVEAHQVMWGEILKPGP